VFPGGCLTVDDVESFQVLSDAMTGPVAGLAVRPQQSMRGEESGQRSIERLTIDVCVRLMIARNAGEDEKLATEAMHTATSVVAKMIDADRTFGGLCDLLSTGGGMIPGAEVNGEPRLVAPRPNQTFYTAVVPVVCGWEIPD
jgi:hypothetical protein